MKLPLLSLCLVFVTGGASASDKETLEKARLAYYSLQREGLAAFQCRLVPDWEFLLADALKADPAAAKRHLATLNKLRFAVDFRTGTPARIMHANDPPANPGQTKDFEELNASMDQMMAGFFRRWALNVVVPPLPEAGPGVEVSEKAGRWNVAYRDGNAAVVVTMDKDFAILSTTARMPEFNGTVLTRFTPSPRGYLLTAWQGKTQGILDAVSTTA